MHACVHILTCTRSILCLHISIKSSQTSQSNNKSQGIGIRTLITKRDEQEEEKSEHQQRNHTCTKRRRKHPQPTTNTKQLICK